MNKFHGTGVALVTPFNANGSVDYPGLERIINHVINGGVDYLISLGTTGEAATLSKDEKKKILEFTAEINNNRVPLVAGAGGNNTLTVAQDIKNIDQKAYNAILSVSPYYNKPTQKGIYEHYKYLAENTGMPIIIYNVPSRTGSNLLAETTCKLAHHFKNIIAIKEAAGSFDQFNQIMRDKPTDFMLISGDDPIALPMISIGAVGVISVIGNALPKPLSEMIKLCLKGDFEKALPIHLSLLEITHLMFAEGNPTGVKSALKQLNICEDYLRLPLVAASKGLNEALAKQLKTMTF